VSGAWLNAISFKLAGAVIQPVKSEMKVDINRIHKLGGHYGEVALKATAHQYDWKVSEKLEVC
jgi:hypothetical protein